MKRQALFHLFTTLMALSLLAGACSSPPATAAPAATPLPAEATEPAAVEPTEPAAIEPTDAPAPTEAPAEPKVLKNSIQLSSASSDPGFWNGCEEALMYSIYEGLVSYKPGTWEVVNTLAESITPSEDGLTIDFKLKEGIQFHHGYGEVTAEDVKFSYERIAGLTEPFLDAPYSADWAALDHVEVTGTYTGQIILKQPDAALWTVVLPMTSGFIVSKKAVEEFGEEFATQGVGTGPYQLDEWSTGERYVLSKFADYTGQNSEYAEPVEWESIQFIEMTDDNAIAIALETDEIDFGRIGTADVEYLDALDTVDAVGKDTLGYRWIGMNVQHPKLQDINVRRAIRSAIDVPSILEAVWDNKFTRTCAIVAAGQLGYWADAPCYERDLDKAREYLAAAGVEDLELEFQIGEDRDGRIIAEIVQANLAEIGITVDVVQLDDAASEEAMLGENAPDYIQLYQSYYTTSPDPSWSMVWFTCDQVTIWNFFEWCSEEFDRLHFAALQETDQDKRAEMYIEMQRIWDEAAHTVWLANPTLFFGYQSDIEPSLMPHAAILAWNFHSK